MRTLLCVTILAMLGGHAFAKTNEGQPEVVLGVHLIKDATKSERDKLAKESTPFVAAPGQHAIKGEPRDRKFSIR